MKQWLFSLFVLLSLSTFAQDQVSTITVKIDPYKSVANGSFFQVLVLSSPDEPGLDYLNGFDFEWGYHYVVKVKKTKMAQPMMDAGDTEYELIEVVSKEKADPELTFTLFLKRELYLGPGEENNSTILKIDDTTFRLLDEVNFTVLPGQKPIIERVLGGEPMRCTFKIGENGDLVLF
ncbi:MAG: DUF4377 domain-containing protein [Cryomorphaceae bacterium]|nr:DUF4377 domain-containing protein [Cryomorphaceae bacterium]